MRSFKIKQNERSCLRTGIFDGSFSVCKAADFSGVDLSGKYTFTGVSDKEKSLICRTENVPADLTKHIAAVSAYNMDYILSRKKTSERLLTHSPGQDIKLLTKGESE